MSEEVFSIELEIRNQKGLHARAAAAFVKTIENLDTVVAVEKAGISSVNGDSIMGLMMLSASKGSTIKITAKGKDAAKAIKELTYLINNKFGED